MKSKKEIIEEYLNHKMFMQLNNMSGAMSDEEYRMAMGSPFAGDPIMDLLENADLEELLRELGEDE